MIRGLYFVYSSSHTRLHQLADFPSSHTRLRQLADFPSLIVRSSFAYRSLILRSSFGVGISKNMGEKILLVFCFELIIYYLCKKKNNS